VKVNLFTKALLFGLFFSFQFVFENVYAQDVNNQLTNIKVENAKENSPLNISAEMLQPAAVSSIKIAYRNFDESQFKIREMEIIGNIASIRIPASEVKLPMLIYYFIISLKDGGIETYPTGIPQQAAPIEVTVYAQSEKEKEILILSPAEGELLSMEDFFVSVSLIKVSDDVDKSLTKIFLNNLDVTSKSVISGDVIVFNPNNFPSLAVTGNQSLVVSVYNKDGSLYSKVERSFLVVKNYQEVQNITGINYLADFQAESRSESFGSTSTWYNNFTANLTSSYYDWTMKGYGYITSEENKKYQPRNRYSIGIYSDWLYLKAGDNYPVFPELIMNGKRLRGFNGGIALGFFNIDAAYGEINREVEGRILNFYNSANKPFQSNIISVDSSKYGYPYAEAEFGTFSRNVFAIRPSFGKGENFQLGLTYLHSKDDLKSIKFGSKPEENVVIGSDLKLAFDDQKIMFHGQSAISLFNKDITNGTLSDSEIDSLFGGEGSTLNIDPKLIKDVKNVMGKFITVNENIGPLNPQELSSLGAEAELQLNYFDNQFRTSYIYRGNDYTSFGQDYIRKDVAGINISDRFRMLDNKVFLTFGFENLNDNLQNTKLSTTNYRTLNSSVSIFSRSDFPDITFGYTRFDNENDIKNKDSIHYVDNSTNKFNIRLSYNFLWSVKHSTSLNIFTSARDDKSIRNMDANYFSTNWSLSSYWSSVLTSYFNFIYYSSNLQQKVDSLDSKKNYNYFTLSFGGKYRMFENNLEVSATLSPSFGDFKRQALDLIAQYFFSQQLRLTFQARVYRIPDQATNSIFGMTLNYSI
jgi:hypothetical protein